MPTVDYDEFLCKQLQDLDFAAGYLTACFEEGEDIFFIGIRNLAKSQNKENLCDMVSTASIPLFFSVTTVLAKLGLELSLKPKIQGDEAA